MREIATGPMRCRIWLTRELTSKPYPFIASKWWLGRESNPRHEDFQSADFTLLLTSSD